MRPRSIIALTAAATTTVACGSIALVHRELDLTTPSSLDQLIPLEGLTLIAGCAAHIPLPKFVRAPLFKAYGNYIGCDFSAISEPLDSYRSLGSFQARKLSKSARPVDESSRVISPADGVLESAGRVAAFGALSVKGEKVSIRELLASDERERLTDVAVNVLTEGEEGKEVSQFGTEEHGLWYAVIRMSPRHAHSFSSPVDWTLSCTRRVGGYLRWLSADAYTANERLSLRGTWDFGAFCLAAVGAPGWGTIVLDEGNTEEENWNGNRTRRRGRTVGSVENLSYIQPRFLKKGESLGCFRMGSAIALVFEAPVDGFEFFAKEGEEVQAGQALASFHTPRSMPSARRFERVDASLPKDNREASSRKQFRRAW